MAEQESIQQQARADLTVRIDDGREDLTLWEHSLRVRTLAEQILMLPEVPAQRVDRLALEAAACYHDAGWVIQFNEGTISRWEIRSRPTSESQRGLAADWMKDRVKGLLTDSSLRLATTAVRQCNRRNTTVIEAQVLAEAENLDEIGPLAIWQQLRRSAGEGKGLKAALEAWHRQKEYRFWEARVKESFRFEQTRRLAQQRLRGMEYCFDSLEEQARGGDMDRLLRTLVGIDRS